MMSPNLRTETTKTKCMKYSCQEIAMNKINTVIKKLKSDKLHECCGAFLLVSYLHGVKCLWD